MAYEYKLQRRVEFAETDMAGIVHFGNFFHYMESAEHAFYRSLGFSAMLSHRDPPLGFPRVHAECDYERPLRFEDLLEVHLFVLEKRAKVLAYQFRFRNLSATPALQVARGRLRVVCVRANGNGGMEAVAIPPEIAAHIEVAPAELLA